MLIEQGLGPLHVGVAWERKLLEYQRLDLDHILLVDSRCVAATLLTRDDAGSWESSDHDSRVDVVSLERLGCRLPLADVYAETGLSEGDPGPDQSST